MLEVSEAVLVRSSEEKNVLTSMQLEFISLLSTLMSCLNNPFSIFSTVGITYRLQFLLFREEKGELLDSCHDFPPLFQISS